MQSFNQTHHVSGCDMQASAGTIDSKKKSFQCSASGQTEMHRPFVVLPTKGTRNVGLQRMGTFPSFSEQIRRRSTTSNEPRWHNIGSRPTHENAPKSTPWINTTNSLHERNMTSHNLPMSNSPNFPPPRNSMSIGCNRREEQINRLSTACPVIVSGNDNMTQKPTNVRNLYNEIQLPTDYNTNSQTASYRTSLAQPAVSTNCVNTNNVTVHQPTSIRFVPQPCPNKELKYLLNSQIKPMPTQNKYLHSPSHYQTATANQQTSLNSFYKIDFENFVKIYLTSPKKNQIPTAEPEVSLKSTNENTNDTRIQLDNEKCIEKQTESVEKNNPPKASPPTKDMPVDKFGNTEQPQTEPERRISRLSTESKEDVQTRTKADMVEQINSPKASPPTKAVTGDVKIKKHVIATPTKDDKEVERAAPNTIEEKSSVSNNSLCDYLACFDELLSDDDESENDESDVIIISVCKPRSTVSSSESEITHEETPASQLVPSVSRNKRKRTLLNMWTSKRSSQRKRRKS